MNAHTQAVGPDIKEKVLSVWDGHIKMRIKVAGAGRPLVYLHPASGPSWDPFLSLLSEQFTVYAPEFPGTSVGDPYAIHSVHSLSDAVLIYEEMIRSLGLDNPILVGSSFGGMLASELAAAFPGLASKVILLDPIGLWREELPIADWLSVPAQEMPALLFHNPKAVAEKSTHVQPENPDVAAAAIAAKVWAVGCTAKFAWPIPDKGLSKRLHRLTAPVLLVWGRNDIFVPVGYVEDWQELLRDCTLAIIDECGHVPQVEKLEETIAAIKRFLQVV